MKSQKNKNPKAHEKKGALSARAHSWPHHSPTVLELYQHDCLSLSWTQINCLYSQIYEIQCYLTKWQLIGSKWKYWKVQTWPPSACPALCVHSTGTTLLTRLHKTELYSLPSLLLGFHPWPSCLGLIPTPPGSSYASRTTGCTQTRPKHSWGSGWGGGRWRAKTGSLHIGCSSWLDNELTDTSLWWPSRHDSGKTLQIKQDQKNGLWRAELRGTKSNLQSCVHDKLWLKRN